MLESLDCLPGLHLILTACLCRKMPAKKGKVAQVSTANDLPEGACTFVRVLRGQMCLLFASERERVLVVSR